MPTSPAAMLGVITAVMVSIAVMMVSRWTFGTNHCLPRPSNAKTWPWCNCFLIMAQTHLFLHGIGIVKFQMTFSASPATWPHLPKDAPADVLVKYALHYAMCPPDFLDDFDLPGFLEKHPNAAALHDAKVRRPLSTRMQMMCQRGCLQSSWDTHRLMLSLCSYGCTEYSKTKNTVKIEFAGSSVYMISNIDLINVLAQCWHCTSDCPLSNITCTTLKDRRNHGHFYRHVITHHSRFPVFLFFAPTS